MSRKTVEPPPTRQELRARHNVRPNGTGDPVLCEAALEAAKRTRDPHKSVLVCDICRLLSPLVADHCHLYEVCDRCDSPDDPCDRGAMPGRYLANPPAPPGGRTREP